MIRLIRYKYNSQVEYKISTTVIYTIAYSVRENPYYVAFITF